MSRPPLAPAPRFALPDAAAAADRIRRLRREAGDVDLDFFPPTVADDVDVDAVVAYVMTHRRIRPEIAAAEVSDRALLIEYQHQRDTALYKARMLSLLRTAHEARVPPRTYGRRLGLPSRAAVHNRRTRLQQELLDPTGSGNTSTRQVSSPAVGRWLIDHARAVNDVGASLVDRRDDLVALVADPEDRRLLVDAIDSAGEHMAARPSRAFAAAVAYAMFLLRAAEPDDGELAEILRHGSILRISFDQARAEGAVSEV